MKGKQREELKNQPPKELAVQLREAREKRFKLGFQQRVSLLKNPLEIRETRRNIARLKTWIRQKG
ncbi:MAG: 50S ribosomal protein L29 [Elusimicrobia bacterium RIFCSPLOWO2_12_FULL_59_9]|nr:MAG: 50S ribosomal protein L29 [Elusimicrobia bacterium RIFCSPLOWO2_12_FULL_59_9]